jgi:cytochrome c biogenesis protein CcmG/thiol:disulfide interchange protein DsbE
VSQTSLSSPDVASTKEELTRPRSGLTLKIGAVLVGVAFLVFAIFVGTRKPATTTTAFSPLLFKPAPTLSGVTIDGGHASLSSLRGRYVVVNFFASWCVACRSEEPQLEAFLRAERGNASVLGVDYDDSNSAASAFLGHYGATWPAIADTSGTNALRWGVDQPPESFVISPTGVVLTKIVGAISASQLERIIVVAKGANAS